MTMHDLKRASSSGVSMSIMNLLGDIASESGSTGVATTVVNLVEPLEFEIHARTSRAGAADLRYVLTIHHRNAKAMWRHQRSFDEYASFQQQVLQALHHGHFCSAGCPWLESFLASAFPHSTLLLSGSSPSLVDKRCKTLVEVLQTLQRFLVNRANYACTHVVNHVAHVFLDFIYGDVIDSHHVLDHFISAAMVPVTGTQLSVMTSSRRRTQSTSALLSTTFAPSATVSVAIESASAVTIKPTHPKCVVLSEEPDICALCGESMPVKDVYVVRLRCGHRFHDECAMPKLNEELKCPTCGVALATLSETSDI